MWNMKTINNIHYGIKVSAECGDYTFVVTDFIKIWKTQLNKKDFCNISVSCNPLMETSETVFLRETMNLFNLDRNDVKWSVDIREENLCLCVESHLFHIPFKFSVSLLQADPKQFYREITLPLFSMLYELQRRQSVLYDLLRKKDAEIIEYNMETAAKTSVIDTTPVFNIEEFKRIQDSCMVNNNIGCIKPAFSDDLNTLYEIVNNMIRQDEELKLNNESVTNEEEKNKTIDGIYNKKKTMVGHQKLIFDENDESNEPSKTEYEEQTFTGVKKKKPNKRKLINL